LFSRRGSRIERGIVVRAGAMVNLWKNRLSYRFSMRTRLKFAGEMRTADGKTA